MPRARPRLRTVNQTAKVVEVSKANLAELATAFHLAKEYFDALHIIKREDCEQFAGEYFGVGRGFWLARVNGELAGCAAVRPLPSSDNPLFSAIRCAELKRMFVREPFRGHGVAQRLLEEAEAFARASGYLWIYLDTELHMTTAARLYDRNGYERCARYNQNPQGMIAMRKFLGGTQP